MRYLLIAFLVLVLAACSETIMLSKSGGETIAKGIMKLRPSPPHRLTVTLDGKVYAGDVESKEVDNSAELRKRYRVHSKRYQAIFSGLAHATYHVHHYTGILKAADGTTLTCDYLSSGGGLMGTCDDGKGQVYEVHR